MLYLSRLIIDTRQKWVRQDLGDCHQLHRRILSAFPEVPESGQARSHFGILYRAEALEAEPHMVRLLVQSSHAPDWSHLPARYLGPTPDQRGNPAVRQIHEEYERLNNGLQLIFRLRANPTRRISMGNGEQAEHWRGKRVELRREADQLAWLQRKGEQCGFQLVSVTVEPGLPDTQVTQLEKLRGRRLAHGEGAAMPLSFGAALFEGRLEVTDRTLFLRSLHEGIGSGKAFGFGLLSIALAR